MGTIFVSVCGRPAAVKMTSHAARLIVYLEFERGELSIWIGICAGRLGTFGIKVGHGGPMLYNGAATCRRTCLLKVPCEGEMIILAHPVFV